MTSDPTTIAVRSGGRSSYRHEPMALSLAFAPLRSADGHDVAVAANVTLRLLDRPADLALFQEQFLATADRVTLDDVRQRLLGPLTTSLSEFIARHDAETCLRQHVAAETLVVQRCDAVGFGCGLAFGPPVQLAMVSESLRLARLKADAAARQLDDLDRVARLSEKLAAVGPAHRLPAAEQSALLPTLLQAAAGRPVKVLVTTGEDLVLIEGTTSGVVALAEELGALRCVVRLSDDPGHRFAIGGQRGVMVLSDTFAARHAYPAPTTSPRGFNSIVRTADDRIVAAHGDLGLAVWTQPYPSKPTVVPTPPSARSLLLIDERVLFAAGGQICAFDGQTMRPIGENGAAILALFAIADGVTVVRQNGLIEQLERQSLRVAKSFRTSSISAATLLHAAGLHALMLAVDHAVECRTRDGELLGRIELQDATLRMIAVAGGRLVGVTADRATVAAWNWTSPPHPESAVNIIARNGHHVTDLLAVDV